MAKGAYIGFNGIARKITTGYIGINGTARKIKKAYVGVNGIAREWYSSGKKLSSCAVGEIVQLPENGTNVEYLVVHQGLPSSLYDESCNGTWLLRKDIYENMSWDANSESYYPMSDIHIELNYSFLPKLADSVKSAIINVKIPYVNSSGSQNIVSSGENGLSTRVFVLSAYEVGFNSQTNTYMPSDGSKLDYFGEGNDTNAKSLRIAYLNQQATPWWLRSPRTNNDDGAWGVNLNGDMINNTSDGNYGARPAFIMNGDTLLDPETNTVLS